MSELWLPWEDTIILDDCLSTRERQALLPHRSTYSVGWRRNQLLPEMKQRRWTPLEDKTLRAHYPNLLLLRTQLVGRTVPAIKTRARNLGLQRPLRPWKSKTVRDLARMTLTMSDAEIAFQLGRTASAIQLVRSRPDVRAMRRVSRPLPLPVLEDLRLIAEKHGMNRRQVDQAIGRVVLSRRVTRFDQATYAKIAEAAALLGAELYAEWDDSDA